MDDHSFSVTPAPPPSFPVLYTTVEVAQLLRVSGFPVAAEK
jgi:hypothetical protein